MSEFIEYPKMVYRGGEQLIVADANEEDAARAEGFLNFGSTAPTDDPAPADKPKRGAKAAD